MMSGMTIPQRETHIGFLGTTHEGTKDGCPLCDLPDGKVVTEQELLDLHATRTAERAEAIAEAWGTHAVLKFPWHR
jgi:hypothetical protein